MSFLTKSQRKAIRNGDIQDKNMMRMRIRKNFAQAIRDLNVVAENHKVIEGDKSITSGTKDKEVAQLVTNLLYIMDTSKIDANILHMLISESEDNWKIDGSETVHGARQEIGISAFLKAFETYDPDDDLTPPPESLHGWDHLEELVQSLP